MFTCMDTSTSLRCSPNPLHGYGGLVALIFLTYHMVHIIIYITNVAITYSIHICRILKRITIVSTSLPSKNHQLYKNYKR